MAQFTQENRRLRIETPLGPDVFVLTQLAGREEISRLFHFRLELLSEDHGVDAKDIVGQPVSIALQREEGDQRTFHGHVSRFAYIGTDDRFSRYTAEVVPWLWFLTRTADCRIFQNKSVPKIVEEIFTELGFQDFETAGIQGAHPDREFCVQYRETDFDFVSRLLEQEGIHYHFRFEEGRHVLVLADKNDAFAACEEDEVEFAGSEDGDQQVTRWERHYTFVPGKWAQTDYNPKTPSTNLLTSAESVLPVADFKKYEIFDYPGAYESTGDGDVYTEARIEAEELAFDVVAGTSSCRTFTAGGTFTLAKHPRANEEGSTYILTSVTHVASSSGSTRAGDGAGDHYENTFDCIPVETSYRPARATPKPVMQGAQTAVVVGPAGEEIHTDDQARVKVQFHWDRLGKRDQDSSCWIRVAQTAAGSGFGSVSIPRIGQEVVVDFLNGDPDRPLIRGCVYNDKNTPPYAAPGAVAGCKTNTTPGGGGSNEISLDDTKGNELITVHAQYDMQTKVENDQRLDVVKNRTVAIGGNDQESVTGNHSLTIEGSRSENVSKDVTISWESSATHSVTKDHSFTVDGSDSMTIGKDRDRTVEGTETISVTKKAQHSYKADLTQEISKSLSVDVGKDAKIEAKSSILLTVGSSKIKIESSKITIETGSSKIVLDSSGVVIKGSQIKAN